jgi:hypothetical protein
MSKAIKTVATTFLRRNRHEFTRPINLIAKEIPDIVEKLLKLCASQDEKIALEAMKALLKHHADMVESKARDEITRLIAQARSGGGLLGGSTVPQNNVPRINFNDIMDIS